MILKMIRYGWKEDAGFTRLVPPPALTFLRASTAGVWAMFREEPWPMFQVQRCPAPQAQGSRPPNRHEICSNVHVTSELRGVWDGVKFSGLFMNGVFSKVCFCLENPKRSLERNTRNCHWASKQVKAARHKARTSLSFSLTSHPGTDLEFIIN